MTHKRCPKQTIIFPHVPKCGGSSLLAQFRESKLAVYFDYDAPPSGRKFFNEKCTRRNQECQLLDFSRFNLVFGYFPIDRYESSHYSYVALLRHPVERAISHYFYWKNVLPENNMMAMYKNPIICDIKSGKIDFLSFINKCNMNHFYASFIGEKRANDFKLVGFIDKYDEFCDNLSNCLGFRVSSSVHLRKREKGEGERISSAEFDRAESMLSDDMRLYESFCQYWR